MPCREYLVHRSETACPSVFKASLAEMYVLGSIESPVSRTHCEEVWTTSGGTTWRNMRYDFSHLVRRRLIQPQGIADATVRTWWDVVRTIETCFWRSRTIAGRRNSK